MWALALAYASLKGRVLYGDGAWYVLVHLLTPQRFNDYDFQRTFASVITQAPVLLGQRLGIERVSVYAALYSFGVFVVPAIAMMIGLWLSRRQPLLFAAIAAAIPIWGFGINFINSEANVMFGFAWLAASIIAMRGPAPLLRGLVLPALALALLRTYEGMLLAGPVLAAWATVAASRTRSEIERIGLVLSTLLFVVAAAIGFGGFVAPRDPNNALRFAESVFAYLRGPHCFLLLSVACALAAFAVPIPRARWIASAASAMFGIGFVVAILRLDGYYSFSVYYHNRTFIVLLLPAVLAALAAIDLWRSGWLAEGIEPYGAWPAIMLVPIAFAVAGDIAGTYRWQSFVASFCRVLEQDMPPDARLKALQASGARTGWAWTHPSMSMLLRSRGSSAMVVNQPGASSWEPFDPNWGRTIPYRGICQTDRVGAANPNPFEVPIMFTGDRFPAYIASVSGLSGPEAWATWTEGPRMELRFKRPLPSSFDLHLRVASAFGRNRELPVNVHAGDVTQNFLADRDGKDVILPFRGVREATALSFDIPSPQSPQELGQGSDARKLGIALVSMTVVPRDVQKN